MIVKFPGEPENIGKVVDSLLREAGDRGNINEEELFKLEICARELLANAVEYGSNFCPEQEIIVELELKNGEILLTVEDMGSGFDHQKFDFNIRTGCFERGRGLAMVGALAENLRFNDKGNRVTVTIRCENNAR